MLLLLVRHAQAGQRDPSRWPDDRLRPITDKGRSRHRQVSRALGRMKLRPDAVLTSPWTRAVQTAEVMVEALQLDMEPEQTEALAATPELDRLKELLARRSAESTIALVGHSPWIEELGSLLLTGDPAGLEIDFPKSGVLGIEVGGLETPDATLRMFLRPRMAKK